MEAETNRSAQDWFRLMIDMGLTPGLRALGFTGAGRRYSMDIDGHCAEIHLVESQSLIDGRVRFTLNLRVPSRNEWTDQLRVRPYYPFRRPAVARSTAWEVPIGHVVTVGGHPVEELWWELEVGHPFDNLAREVLTMLTLFGLPALRAQIHTTR